MSGQQHRASRCVFVGNIPYDATEEQLVQICEEVGPVVSFRLVVDRDTGKPKGYGFCEFRDEETALSARRNLQGYDINGRQLRVDFAENEKGGGGVDRNREQGRGGPGFQQTGSHLDVQKQGGGGGPPQLGFGQQSGFVGAAPMEQPFGRAAASAAAAVMASALGGAQQLSNMMVQGQGQGQGPMQSINHAPTPLNGGAAGSPDLLTSHLAGMSKHQLYEIMSQMKIMIQQNQHQARQILVANPQLTKALFQAQIMLGMVRPPQGIASQSPQVQHSGAPQQQHQQQQQQHQQQQQQQQQQQPRPPQPHASLQNQMQPHPTKPGFQPPLPQQPQQQPLPPQQQQQLPPPSQGSFQGGNMVQSSMGMGFQQGPPPPPNQPPPQQLYQMGSNMMGANLQRMGGGGTGVPVGQGTGGLLSGGGSMSRGPALTGGLGSLQQLGHLSSTGPMGGMSAVHGQAPLPVANPMVSGNVGGVGAMGQSLSSSLAGPQMMGEMNRGYGGMNTGMNSPMNTGMNLSMSAGLNSSLNTSLNTGMDTPVNSGLNPVMTTGIPQGLNPGFNAAIAMNTGLPSNMNAGINTVMNPGLTMGLNVAPQVGGFPGTIDGTSVTTATLQPPTYSQMPMQAPTAPQPQLQQGQMPIELEQQKALLQQVLNLTSEQIMSLPPDQRQQVLQLQQALR